MVSARRAEQVERPHDALSIAELYNEVDGVLARGFPRSRMLWVRGEIQQLSDRTGHCYIDLVDPDGHRGRQAAVLKVKCWRSSWQQLRTALAREGLDLEPGMVVVMRGSLDFYRARAELSFILAEIDVTALLGRMAARRAELLRTLRAEGLLERNRALPLPPVPLRVGLVASPGSEGYRDFLGQLEASGWGFQVAVAPALMQGRSSPGSVATALHRVRRHGPDLVVVVRGGGSKGDLTTFDQEVVARAIATMEVPVWTGIGHSGDESVADLVAHRAHITPTECGRELTAQVTGWWETEVAERSEAIGRLSLRTLEDARHRAQAARRHLLGSARHQLHWHRERLSGQTALLRTAAPRRVQVEEDRVRHRAGRLGPLATAQLERSAERLTAWRRLVAAYDVERQLERGYTLTLDAEGRVVRSARAVEAGEVLDTRFADGSVRSVVEAARVRPDAAGADGEGAP